MKTLLFVYGTLKRGGSNVRHMGDSKYLGQAVLAPGLTLYTNGGFPMMVESQNDDCVCGELYEVGEEVLERLDRFEGHPYHFERKPAKIASVTWDGEPPSPELAVVWSESPEFVADAYHYRGSVDHHKHLGSTFPVKRR